LFSLSLSLAFPNFLTERNRSSNKNESRNSLAKLFSLIERSEPGRTDNKVGVKKKKKGDPIVFFSSCLLYLFCPAVVVDDAQS
jgi:hypothetical protein